mmetsp:Transcript_24961/g.55384  ORF Transcript_24961/g.55384 Transcript_24961/m.55384 type:complete len:209 (-) Transcript_24961:39-665(-)
MLVACSTPALRYSAAPLESPSSHRMSACSPTSPSLSGEYSPNAITRPLQTACRGGLQCLACRPARRSGRTDPICLRSSSASAACLTLPPSPTKAFTPPRLVCRTASLRASSSSWEAASALAVCASSWAWVPSSSACRWSTSSVRRSSSEVWERAASRIVESTPSRRCLYCCICLCASRILGEHCSSWRSFRACRFPPPSCCLFVSWSA